MESIPDTPWHSRSVNHSDIFHLKVDKSMTPQRVFEDHLEIINRSYQKKTNDIIYDILKGRGHVFDNHDQFINFINLNIGLSTFSCSDNPSETKAVYSIIGESVPILWSKSTVAHIEPMDDVIYCNMVYNFYLEDPDGHISSKIPGVAKV